MCWYHQLHAPNGKTYTWKEYTSTSRRLKVRRISHTRDPLPQAHVYSRPPFLFSFFGGTAREHTVTRYRRRVVRGGPRVRFAAAKHEDQRERRGRALSRPRRLVRHLPVRAPRA